MTTGEIIALTRWTFVSNVMSLLLNMLSRFVIVFPPRSKHFLISWLQSPSAVILEPKKIKEVSHCFHCFPIYLPWSMGLDTMILVFGSPTTYVSAIYFSLLETGFTFIIVKFHLIVACCIRLVRPWKSWWWHPVCSTVFSSFVPIANITKYCPCFHPSHWFTEKFNAEDKALSENTTYFATRQLTNPQ